MRVCYTEVSSCGRHADLPVYLAYVAGSVTQSVTQSRHIITHHSLSLDHSLSLIRLSLSLNLSVNL